MCIARCCRTRAFLSTPPGTSCGMCRTIWPTKDTYFPSIRYFIRLTHTYIILGLQYWRCVNFLFICTITFLKKLFSVCLSQEILGSFDVCGGCEAHALVYALHNRTSEGVASPDLSSYFSALSLKEVLLREPHLTAENANFNRCPTSTDFARTGS